MMRRRLGIAAILALAALLLAGCASTKDAGGPDPLLRGQWELQDAKDARGPLPIANQHITLTINGDQDTGGRSSCSDYTARVFGPKARLWVSATVAATQSCDTMAQQQLETRYIRDLDDVHYGTLAGGILTFHATNLTLTFARAIYIPLTFVTNRSWQIESIAPDVTSAFIADENATAGGVLVSLPAGEQFTEFDASGAKVRFSKSGSLTGSDACRSFSSGYDENAGELVINNLKSAKFGCNAKALEVDAYLMNALTSGFTWQSANGQLVIDSSRSGVEITFVENPLRGGDLG